MLSLVIDIYWGRGDVISGSIDLEWKWRNLFKTGVLQGRHVLCQKITFRLCYKITKNTSNCFMKNNYLLLPKTPRDKEKC